MGRRTRKSVDSKLAEFLATVATSVLVQYGVDGRVKQVTQQLDQNVWRIELLTFDSSVPPTIMVRCSDATPPHVVRTAMVAELGI